MTDSGDRIGSLSVDITADLGPLEAKKAAAAEILDALVKTPYVIKVDSSELTSARQAVQMVRDALLQVQKSAVEPGANTTRTLKFDVDTAKIRADIESALKDPFQITLQIANIDAIRKEIGSLTVEVVHTGAAHGPAPAAATAPAQGPDARAGIRQTISENPSLAKTINGLYDALENRLSRAGKPSLPATPDPTDRILHLAERIGRTADDFITVNNVNKRGEPLGGAFSKKGIAAMGLDPTSLASLMTAAQDLVKATGSKALFAHLQTAGPSSGPAPAPAPAAQVQQQATANAQATGKMLREIVPKAATPEPTPRTGLLGAIDRATAETGPIAKGRFPPVVPVPALMQALHEAVTNIDAGRAPIRSRRGSTNPEYGAGTTRFGGEGGAPTAEDIAAEQARSPSEMQAQSNRRLFGRVGGANRDLTAVAEAAASGVFERYGQEVGGQKRYVRLFREHVESSPEGELAPFQRRTARGGVKNVDTATIEGVEVKKLKAWDVLMDYLRQSMPDVHKYLEEGGQGASTLKGQLNAFLRTGANLPWPGSGVTYTATGQTGRGTPFGSGLGVAGSGFSEGTVKAAKEAFLRDRVMGAQLAMNPNYRAELARVVRDRGEASRATVEKGIGSDRINREHDAALEALRIRRGIEGYTEGEVTHPPTLPDPLKVREKMMADLSMRTAGGMGPGQMGDRAATHEIRESYHRIIDEISQAFGLGINTSGPTKKVNAQLEQAGMGYLSSVPSSIAGEHRTRELFATQDLNRQRQPGGNDRGEGPVTMEPAPMVPSQRRAREARELAAALARGQVSEPTRVEAQMAPPLGYETTPIQFLEGGLSSEYKPKRGPLPNFPIQPIQMLGGKSDRYADMQPDVTAAVANLRKQAYEELSSTREAYRFVDAITGSTSREVAPERVAEGFGQVGGRPRRVYGGRKIREIPHRYEPRFDRSVANNEDPAAERETVLGALQPEALERREAELRAQIQAATSGGDAVDVADIQRQLENVINVRKSPGVQEDIRALYDKRTGIGVGRARRRGATAGATSQQIRERFAATMGDYLPGNAVTGDRPIVPYSRGVPIPPTESTASPMTAEGYHGGGGGGAPGGPSGPGASGGGSSSTINVRIIGPLPVPVTITNGGRGGEANTSGIGGVGRSVPREMYPSSAVKPGVAGPAGGPAAASAAAEEEKGNQTGSLKILRSPKTAALPESMQIRMRPRVVVSAEQRAQERAEQQERDSAAASLGIQGVTSPSTAALRRLGVTLPQVNTELSLGLNEDVAQARAAARAAQGRLPQRALSTSLVQIAENIFGGREGPTRRLAELNNRIGDVESGARLGSESRIRERAILATRREVAGRIRGFVSRGEEVPDTLRKQFQGLGESLDSQRGLTKALGEVTKKASEDVAKMAPAAVTASDVLRNLGAGAIGGAFGGVAAGAVATLGQGAVTVTEKLFGPVLERMLGFQNTTGALVGSLSDATRAQQGNTHAVIAQAAANAGLSKSAYDAVAATLEQRVSVEAGNKAIADQIQLYHAVDNIQGGRGPVGDFFQGTGGTPGLTRSTGGLFGTQIGATPSTIEQIAGELPGGNDMIANAFPFLTNLGESIANLVPGRQRSVQDITLGINGPQITKTLDRFNKDAEKAGSSLRLVANASDEQVAATQKNLEERGVEINQRRQFENARIAVIGGTGTAGTGDINDFLAASGQGALLQDPEVALETMRRQITAQVHAIQRAEHQQLVSNVAEVGIENAVQPLAPVGRGLTSPNAPQFVRDRVSAAADADASRRRGITALGEAGTSILESEYNVPHSLITNLQTLGKEIDALRQHEADVASSNFWDDWNQDVKVSTRNIANLVGLVKGVGGTANVKIENGQTQTVGASRVGVLEARNIEIGRESQQLSFQEQERNLNFSEATIGFQTMGSTPEEIAANREQQRYENSFKRKQLGLAEEGAKNNYEITTTVNKDALDDAIAAREKLARDVDLKVTVQLDEDAIASLQKNQEQVLKNIQAYQTAGAAVISAASDQLTGLEQQADIYFKFLSDRVIKAYKDAFGTFPPTGTTTPPGSPTTSPATPTGNNNRTDRMDDTGGPGDMGSGNIVVQINGGNFTDEQSRLRLINDVQVAVEQGLNRKASLIGLRTPR